MELEVALKMGFLFIPPNNFLRKTWLKRYCALYNASHHGIQRMELFESEDAYVKQSPSKIVPLTDCWKVTPLSQKHQPNVFEVRTKSNSYQFSAETFQEMSEWLVNLQTVAFSKAQFKASTPPVPTNEEKQEENLLYCSMDEPEVYSVRALATEAVLRNNLKGDYKLIITSVSFSIAEECSVGRIGRVFLTWPYRHIRRYGCSLDTFSFEAGRKCASGEGLFTFSTNDGSKIFQSVDGHVSALKTSQGEGDIPNSPSIKDDKNNCFTSKDSLNNNEPTLCQIINKPDYSIVHDSNNEAAMNLKCNFKPTPPFKKPPRKSKTNAYDHFADNIPKVNNTTSEDSQNQYAEICRSGPDTLKMCSETSHVSSNFFKFSGESSKMSQSSFNANVSDASKTSQVPDKSELSPCVENLKISEVSKKDIKVKPASYIYNYENCGHDLEIAPQFSRSTYPAEHIYGKISSARQSAPSSTENTHTYGSILSSSNPNPGGDTSPLYCNLPYLKEALGDNNHGMEQEPEHFMKNDAEYAQVLKKNKNSS